MPASMDHRHTRLALISLAMPTPWSALVSCDSMLAICDPELVRPVRPAVIIVHPFGPSRTSEFRLFRVGIFRAGEKNGSAQSEGYEGIDGGAEWA